MAHNKIAALILDTSYLRSVSISNDPDFMRLLRFCKERVIDIFVPHIVWEERRAQYLDGIYAKVVKANEAFRRLNEDWDNRFITGSLPPPRMDIPSRQELILKSREVFTKFASDHGLKIVPLAGDHAHRTWERYFNWEPPFNGSVEKNREERRKDIPDAWIFETAIDLLSEHGELQALCRDEKLSALLRSRGIAVIAETSDVLAEIDRVLSPQESAEAPSPERVASEAGLDEGETATDKLTIELSDIADKFRDLDIKVLGFVGYVGSPTKEQLVQLISDENNSADMVRNSAERLALEGLIKDTGNYYLPGDAGICELAATAVEADLIRLLKD